MKRFGWSDTNRHLRVEVIAGITTFLAMAYIIIVNPVILNAAGMPLGPAMVATIVTASLASILTGLYARKPYAMAPYMGENAFFAFAVVIALGVTWMVALGAVFVAGVIFFAISVSGARKLLLESIPPFLAASWGVAIGLFLAFIGLANAGISVPGIPGAPVGLGNFTRPEVLLAFVGIGVSLFLYVKRVPGSILIGIVLTIILGFAAGASGFGDHLPEKVPSPLGPIPDWSEVLFKMDFAGLASAAFMIPVIVVMFLMDFLDTTGTVMGLGSREGTINGKGRFPGVEKVMHIDSLSTMLGAIFGTSTTGVYIESAAGIEQGGRTGVTAVVVGLMFLASLALTPFFSNLPTGFLQLAAAPALVTVGVLMMRPIKMIDFDDVTQAIPATLTIAFMLFTFNIGFGLAVGIVSYPVLMAAVGKRRQVKPLMWVLFILGVLLFLIFPYK